MTYLVVAIDYATMAPWHQNIGSRDVAGAVRTALDRAEASVIDLVVAADRTQLDRASTPHQGAGPEVAGGVAGWRWPPPTPRASASRAAAARASSPACSGTDAIRADWERRIRRG